MVAPDPHRPSESWRRVADRLRTIDTTVLDRVRRQLEMSDLPARLAQASQPSVVSAMSDAIRRANEQSLKALTGGVMGENLRRLQEQVARTQSTGSLARFAERMARANTVEVQRLTAQITLPYSNQQLRAMGGQVSRAYRLDLESLRALQTDIDWSSLEAAAQDFEVETKEAETAGPQPEEPAALAWWLASRQDRVQLALLLQALQIINAIGPSVVEEMTGEEVPESVRVATTTVLAIATFLLMWIDYRMNPPEG